MQGFRKILKIDLINLFTNPMWIFYAIGFPIALILVMGFLTSGGYGGSVSSYDYYGVAIMLFGVFNASTFAANSFMEERIKAPNMRIVFSPVRPFCIHFSKVLATFLFCVVTCTLDCALLHFTLGVNYGGTLAWAVYLLMVTALFFFSALGVLVCCIVRSESTTNTYLSNLLVLFAILGGLFFRVDGMGKVIAAVSWVSPAKWLLTASLQIIYDRDLHLLLPACAALALLSAAAVLLSAKFFHGEDYL